MLSGTRLLTSHFCKPASICTNIGNALNTARPTVTSGTSEMMVVNARLPAVRPSLSSRKRSRSVCTVLAHGNSRAARHQACHICRAVAGVARGLGQGDSRIPLSCQRPNAPHHDTTLPR